MYDRERKGGSDLFRLLGNKLSNITREMKLRLLYIEEMLNKWILYISFNITILDDLCINYHENICENNTNFVLSAFFVYVLLHYAIYLFCSGDIQPIIGLLGWRELFSYVIKECFV